LAVGNAFAVRITLSLAEPQPFVPVTLNRRVTVPDPVTLTAVFALDGLTIAAEAEPVEPTTLQPGVPPETEPVKLNPTVPCAVWQSVWSVPAAALAVLVMVACFEPVALHPTPAVTVTPMATLPEAPAVQLIWLVP
jgi:hypothetical protein